MPVRELCANTDLRWTGIHARKDKGKGYSYPLPAVLSIFSARHCGMTRSKAEQGLR
jgi:hypothetical protein